MPYFLIKNFEQPVKNQEPAKGKLLISEPFMEDPNFKRTVILLCEHNEEGAFGLVLNRKSEYSIGDAIEDLKWFDVPLYYGGPVQPDTLHYLHNKGTLIEGSVELAEGLYWGGNFESVVKFMNTGLITTDDIRFYVGYSGWDTEQLVEEMKGNSWFVADNKADYIFTEEEDKIWRTVLRDMGGDFRIISNFPIDPTLN